MNSIVLRMNMESYGMILSSRSIGAMLTPNWLLAMPAIHLSLR